MAGNLVMIVNEIGDRKHRVELPAVSITNLLRTLPGRLLRPKCDGRGALIVYPLYHERKELVSDRTFGHAGVENGGALQLCVALSAGEPPDMFFMLNFGGSTSTLNELWRWSHWRTQIRSWKREYEIWTDVGLKRVVFRCWILRVRASDVIRRSYEYLLRMNNELPLGKFALLNREVAAAFQDWIGLIVECPLDAFDAEGSRRWWQLIASYADPSDDKLKAMATHLGEQGSQGTPRE